MNASMEDLALCPGLGPSKVQRIYEMFHQPLKRSGIVSTQEKSWLPEETQRASSAPAEKRARKSDEKPSGSSGAVG